MKNRLKEFRIPLLAFAFLSVGAVLSWQHYFEAAFPMHREIWTGVFVSCGLFLAALLIGSMRQYGHELRQVELSRQNYEEAANILQQQLDSMQSHLEEWVHQSASLMTLTSVDEVCAQVMEMLEKTLGADQGSIMLLDRSRCLRIAASRGIPDEIASKVHIRLGERIAGVAASENREFLIVGDFDNYPLFHDLEVNPIIKSAIICPVVYQHEVLGVLNVSRTLHHQVFTPEDLKKAKYFARYVGIAIHHAAVCQQLEAKGREMKDMYRQLKASHHEMMDSGHDLNLDTPPRKLKAS